MNFRTMCRIGGVLEAGIFAYAGSFVYETLSSVNYNFLPTFFLGDYPIEHKIIGGAYVGMMAALAPICAFGIADGITDIIKGTHHYLGLKSWHKLSKNPKTKARLQNTLDKMLESPDYKVF